VCASKKRPRRGTEAEKKGRSEEAEERRGGEEAERAGEEERTSREEGSERSPIVFRCAHKLFCEQRSGE
jgi:hypothetical protein